MQDQWRKEIDEVLEGKRRWCVVTGDCLEVLPLLPSGCVDAVVTDPPYGVGFRGKKNSATQKRSGDGYSTSCDEDMSVIVESIQLCIRKFSRCVVTPGTRSLFKYPIPDDIGSVFIPNAAGYGRWGFTGSQPILYYGACPYNANALGARQNSFSSTESSEENGHPCPKPIGWMKWLVKRASLDGETVLDPYCGSGTTLVAAIQTGRRAIGIEIDPNYADIARRRCEKAEREQRELLFPAIDAPRQQTIEDLLSE